MYMAGFSSTGPLDLQTIGQAAGDTAPHSLSEYYNISFTDGSSTPSTGTISIGNFLGKTIGSAVTYNWSQQAKLTDPYAQAGDQFGRSVSVSGNYAIVGAPRADVQIPFSSGYADAGEAQIYVRSGTTWNHQAALGLLSTSTGASGSDYFGFSVSIDGDYAIVGSPFEDPNGISNGGSAHIYVRSGSTWSYQTKLNRTTSSSSGAYFGYSVAISGNYAIVGAPRQNRTSLFYTTYVAGAAYIYVRSGTTWSWQRTLRAPDLGAYDQFGYSVSIDSNPNTGVWVIVGAPYEDPNGFSGAGSAYIWYLSGTTWYHASKVIASDTQASAKFGENVDISDTTAIVGCPLNDFGATDAGAAYVYVRQSVPSAWIQQAKLTASDYAYGDWFGWDVAIENNRAVVGAWREDAKAPFSFVPDAGSAYVFDRSGSVWTETKKLIASDKSMYDNAGVSVSLSGNTVIVGAYKDDHSSSTDAGSAYVYIT